MSSCASLEALDTSHDGKISYCPSIWVDAMPEEHDGHRYMTSTVDGRNPAPVHTVSKKICKHSFWEVYICT